MLEVGDCDEPVVYPEVGDEVPDEEVGEAELLVEEEESTGGDCETNVGEDDQEAVLVLVQWTCRVEVVDTGKPAVLLPLATSFTLASVKVVSSYVGRQVQPPAKQLLGDHV